ncbi:hypothetical protein VTK26DRAFT_1366 [Humicola hyalothermophila]
MLSVPDRSYIGVDEAVLEAEENQSALMVQGSSHDTQLRQYMAGELVEALNKTGADEQLVPFKPATGDHASITPTSKPAFLDWSLFDAATLPPRANPKRSRLSSILSPLNALRADLPGNVTVEGLGGIIESAHSLFHSAQRLDFMESERTILIFQPGTPKSPAKALARRELERYENELFDVSKYAAGAGACEYLTALAWTDEGLSGSIALYEAVSDEEGETAGIRPVAAMRDVPTPVLVKMRTNERVGRKLVFAPVDHDGDGFRPRWRANPSPGPSYVRLEGNRWNAGIGNPRGAAASPLRSPRRSQSRRRSRSRHPAAGRLADADGVSATIPQLVALLHARRAVLEEVRSSCVATVRTEDGEVRPAVALFEAPRSNPHDGDGGVHVAVLIPEDAPWADEEIVWTGRDGLVEFRQARYWDLIQPVRSRRDRSKSGSRSRHRERSRGRHLQSGHRSGSRMRSPSQRPGRSCRRAARD